MSSASAASPTEEQVLKDIENYWATIREERKTEEDGPGIPSPLWTQARTQMQAIKERAEKRVKAQEARIREREENMQAFRREAEEAQKMQQVLQVGDGDTVGTGNSRTDNVKRDEARRREREKRQTMARTVKLEEEEVWDVF